MLKSLVRAFETIYAFHIWPSKMYSRKVKIGKDNSFRETYFFAEKVVKNCPIKEKREMKSFLLPLALPLNSICLCRHFFFLRRIVGTKLKS